MAGKGKFEISALSWGAGIDPTPFAWNDTFVHPDSTHWLIEDNHLTIPGLTGRIGLSAKTDLGVYATKSPRANYGFCGAELVASRTVRLCRWASVTPYAGVSSCPARSHEKSNVVTQSAPFDGAYNFPVFVVNRDMWAFHTAREQATASRGAKTQRHVAARRAGRLFDDGLFMAGGKYSVMQNGAPHFIYRNDVWSMARQ